MYRTIGRLLMVSLLSMAIRTPGTRIAHHQGPTHAPTRDPIGQPPAAPLDVAALLNAAQGATWVAIGNGGGVGIGRSIHSGMVVVADGSELAERKCRRVFWSDPALGVARYADAGYESAVEQAGNHQLKLPSLDTPGR